MVFSSIPVYLDPPNWQQQPNQQGGVRNENPQLPPLPPPPHVGGGGTGSIRPGSMADRARLAKIPQPELALKCPRCESTNTKFCYFNNYSLSQPRHFCKTCRRYWTRGGALRNVPVGGGCRRNKKSKSQSSSKSPVSSEGKMDSNSSSTNAVPSEIIGTHGAASGSSGQTDMGFQMGSNSGMSTAILPTGGVQQFPFFEPPPTGLYPFQSEGVEASTSMVGDIQLRSLTSRSRVSQLAPVKMEDNQGLNLSKPFLGISESNQYWNGNNWTDLSGLNSSSSSHLF
ncbi:hypothetical protein GH714_004352 [Hevea brasiliensis]|uniref:Dof zinc finger protein n=1 Tax=Hevea brasiliensis TaxID=3981 RepID=A0A6A6NBF7_HEVBR|nr:hypothetical protein GH714_004352 [Hevea brasiliensis]